MKIKSIIKTFLLILIITSCKTDQKSELLTDYLIENHSVNTKNKKIKILVYNEIGCNSCNKEIQNYLDTIQEFKFDYLLYIAEYPGKLYKNYKNKFSDKILLERSNYLYRLDIGFSGSGKIIVENEKIVETKQYNPNITKIYNFFNP